MAREEEPTPPAPKLPKGPRAIDFSTPKKKFASIASWLLPFLAPENRSTMNAWMQRNVPGLVKPTAVGPIPGQMTSGIRTQYLSADRAQSAQIALARMQQAAKNPKNLGPGFTFLQQAIGLLDQFGNDSMSGTMNRQKYTQFANSVTALLKDAGDERNMKPYVELATMFLRPNFSAGPLMPGAASATQDGRYLYGQANTRFFS